MAKQINHAHVPHVQTRAYVLNSGGGGGHGLEGPEFHLFPDAFVPVFLLLGLHTQPSVGYAGQ